jgi:hypothetical protein
VAFTTRRQKFEGISQSQPPSLPEMRRSAALKGSGWDGPGSLGRRRKTQEYFVARVNQGTGGERKNRMKKRESNDYMTNIWIRYKQLSWRGIT